MIEKIFPPILKVEYLLHSRVNCMTKRDKTFVKLNPQKFNKSLRTNC